MSKKKVEGKKKQCRTNMSFLLPFLNRANAIKSRNYK